MSDAALNAAIRETMLAAGNRFYSVEFVKKTDNTYRRVLIRNGAGHDTIKGTRPEATENRKKNNPDLVNVWVVDLDKDQIDTVDVENAQGELSTKPIKFRSFHLGSVIAVTYAGTRHEFRRLPKRDGAIVIGALQPVD